MKYTYTSSIKNSVIIAIFISVLFAMYSAPLAATIINIVELTNKAFITRDADKDLDVAAGITVAALATTTKPKKVNLEPRNVAVKITDELTCMARNIYFEAAYQPEKGKIAVANVTMHRVKNKNYPSTVCGVVYFRHSNACAFSWTCDSKADVPPKNEEYKDAIRIASLALTGKLEDVTSGADHFHANHVKPAWARYMKLTTKIGDHLFYSSKNMKKETYSNQEKGLLMDNSDDIIDTNINSKDNHIDVQNGVEPSHEKMLNIPDPV